MMKIEIMIISMIYRRHHHELGSDLRTHSHTHYFHVSWSSSSSSWWW